MSQKVLSIIVPTYNMEKYLTYCMDSFLIHKNLNKLEVLIVNDGSTDKSLEIARRYVSRAGDVFKIIDKKTEITAPASMLPFRSPQPNM